VTDHPLPADLAGAHALILSLTERVSNAEAHATASRNEVENARRAARIERVASEAAKVEAALAKAARIALEVEIEQLIPSPFDQNRCAQSRSPMDMMRQG